MKTKEVAKLLNDVSPEHCFRLHNTEIEVRNLVELGEALQIMSDEVFEEHANDKKNDFARWVSEIIKDDELSNRLVGVTDRRRALKIVAKRIRKLQKQSGQVARTKANFLVGLSVGIVLGAVLVVVLFKVLSLALF